MAIEDRTFYHGTDKEAIPYIQKAGGLHPGGGGYLNSAVYISERWRTALFFGNELFKVKLKKATRVLDLDKPYDPKVLEYLSREFKGITKAKNPNKIIPKNKHLTNKEVKNLIRYFHHRTQKQLSKNFEKVPKELLLRMDKAVWMYYRGWLIKHGYHAYGHAEDRIGYAVFDETRIESIEHILSIPVGTWMKHIKGDWSNFDREDFGRFKTLEALMKKVNQINSNLKRSSPSQQ